MSKRLAVMIVILSLAACAHRGAVRVECDGVLRLVNTPIEAHAPPVIVVPGSPTDNGAQERQP